MALSWRLLRLLLLHLLISDQTVNYSHGGFDGAGTKEVEVEYAPKVTKSAGSGWVSRRLMAQQYAKAVVVIGAPPGALPSPADLRPPPSPSRPPPPRDPPPPPPRDPPPPPPRDPPPPPPRDPPPPPPRDPPPPPPRDPPPPPPRAPPPLQPPNSAPPVPTPASTKSPTIAPEPAPTLAPTPAPALAPAPAPALAPAPAPALAPAPAPALAPGPSVVLPPFNATPPSPALFQPAAAPSPHDLEREAVLYFKGELTADPTGVFKLWNDSNNANHCNWYGIQCNDDGRVIALTLPNRLLQGVVTRRIVDLPLLEVLDLGGNSISGPVPDGLGLLQRLRTLRLNGNSLGGPFPGSLASCTNIEELDVNGCGVSDEFPAMLRNFRALRTLNLGENAFTGAIPIWLGWSPTLQFLHLGGNQFSGEVPISLLNCTSLQFLNISANNLTGSIDSTVGNLVRLQTHLDMSYNQFSGLIPLAIGNLQELIGLNLSGNAFTGSIPVSLGNCTKLQSLDLSNNKLSGSLPESLRLLRDLTFLMDFSHNEVEGLIPGSIGDLHNLTKLDLSFNKLTGPIPESIAGMRSLRFVNVSMNQLQGRVPDIGLFSNLLPDSFLGNPGLCGRMVGRSCTGEAVTAAVATHKKTGPTLVTIIGAAAEGFVLLIFAALLIQYVIHRRRPALEKNVVLFSKYFKALKLTAEEIQAATNGNLNESAFSRTLSGNIRRGADFSKIEKAVLPDGTVFAVKQWCIAKFRKRDRHKLDAEMLNFSRIRHRNLVRLMGYYMSPSSLALLMEFCPNSSLDVHLHPPGSQPCQLNWNDRLRIIMGVTTGLVYLHHETCGNAVVHCDLKAANVLLDSDMEPKLVDFGMARLIKGNSKGATAASWIGSSGYVPPEYGFAGDCTKAGDVYSYGVLLLEIITGKRPSSEEVTSGMTLPVWVRSLQAQDRERYAIDIDLFQASDEPQLKQILHIMDAALLCTGHVPSTRPTMLQVLDNLQGMPESVTEEAALIPVESAAASVDFDN